MGASCDVKNKPVGVKELLRSWYFWKPVLGIFVGAIAGFAYYYFVGCKSGTCPINSNPYISTAWGGLLGYFLVSPCKSC